jgi:Ca2+-binding EF-hand superfamily protein
MKFWSMVLICLVAGFVAMGNTPAKAAKLSAEEQFKALDTNSDNVLSLEEFSAWKRFHGDKAKAETAFKKANKAGDGKLTLDEFKAYVEKRAAKKDKAPPPQ